MSITSPVSGATVSGTITITTNVSANTTSVQLSVDGSNVGAAVTSAPFSFSLNTTTLSNGVHSLIATASNASGQTTTSSAVSIKVDHAVPPTAVDHLAGSRARPFRVPMAIHHKCVGEHHERAVQRGRQATYACRGNTVRHCSLPLDTTTLSNGVHSLIATASNAGGQTTTSAAVAINVNNPHLQITTSALPGGQVQVSYSTTLQASGGTPTYTWAGVSGQLPDGLSLSSSGTISGTPTLAGSFTVTIGVNDSAGHSASSVFSIDIATVPPPSTTPFGR